MTAVPWNSLERFLWQVDIILVISIFYFLNSFLLFFFFLILIFSFIYLFIFAGIIYVQNIYGFSSLLISAVVSFVAALGFLLYGGRWVFENFQITAVMVHSKLILPNLFVEVLNSNFLLLQQLSISSLFLFQVIFHAETLSHRVQREEKETSWGYAF